MTRIKTAGLLGLMALAGVACSERTPTSVDPGLVASRPTSVEVRLPWEQFGSHLGVFGGFGHAYDLGTGVVARSFGGVLDARTLVRLTPLATTATVTDSAGTSRTDTLLTLKFGRLVARLDTVESVAPGPVTLELGAMRQRWHASSASWAMAVDTAGDKLAWGQPGAGPVERVATAVWDPSKGDSVVFFLDTAGVRLFRDTSEVRHGALLGLVTPGARLKVDDVALRATMKASLRDTLLELTAEKAAITFVYAPGPGAPASSLRVGGAPAWRTTLDIEVPFQLSGPPALCAVVGCPIKLTPSRVNYAALVLSTGMTETAFQPTDSIGLEVRAVYDRTALPKSPLGPALIGGYGKRLGPDLFRTAEGTEVEIPITNLVRAILQGDTVDGFPPPRSLALLTAVEPSSLGFATFFGPGTSKAPRLRLIVSAGRSVELP